MKRKLDYHLILGIFLFSIGSISTSYSIITLILGLLFYGYGHFGIIIYIKDMLFDVVFILLGLILIAKKRSKNFRRHQIS